MLTINPYLTFPGKGREMMTFYQQCLGGELTMQTVGESPMASQWPPHLQESILHASLIKEGKVLLLGSEVGEGNEAVAGNMINISLTCSGPEELRECFNKLSAGGEATRPPHDFFAGTIAALKDQFGIHWILYFAKQ